MPEEYRFLALDIGAESGRGELVTLRDGKVHMEEVHRFANRPVRLAGTLYWDFPSLYAEVLAAMRACSHRGVKILSAAVDTWGVDFGLLGSDGRLLGNPVQYRDARTENIHAYSDRFLSREEIFAATGYEPWAISSLFQLLAMQRDHWPTLELAETFLNMPDLFHYFLTGVKACEYSVVNTSNLMSLDCRWARRIMQAFGLAEKMFPKLIPPATVLGPLLPAVRDETGLGDIPIVAVCGHDTSAAVAAVGGQGPNWAFLSCGTWSILGSLIDHPVATPRCLELGFTNEYTLGGWYLARNILGLWLIQQLRRKWDRPGDPWDYGRLTAEAAKSVSNGTLVNVADETFLAPPDMEEALLAAIRGSGQTPPADRGGLVRCVLESLALEYAYRLDSVGELTGKPRESLYMVGGGTANKLLCQWTADACGRPVYAGADQCTAMGNALCQAVALGILKDKDQVRQVMRESFALTCYEPSETAAWKDKKAKYARLQAKR
jgi:rhamnulokinase